MVTLNDLNSQKVKIDYPCQWEYKLFGRSAESITSIVKNLAGEKPHKISLSNKSSGGKFVSLTFEIIVHTEEERLYFFEELGRSKEILQII